jgi:predicted GIY-YIG superfamily endonuclease
MDCRNKSGNDTYEGIVVEDGVYAVYLLASKPSGTLYLGVTSNIIGRVWQHKESVFDGFSKKYGVHRLVWLSFSATSTSPFNVRRR